MAEHAVAVAVDVHDLAGKRVLVVGPEGDGVDSAELRAVAGADVQRAVGQGAHSADRVRVAVGRQAVGGRRGGWAGAARHGGAAEDDLLGADRLVAVGARADRELREPRAHRVAGILRRPLIDVEQVEEALALGPLAVHRHPEDTVVTGHVDVVGDVDHVAGLERAVRAQDADGPVALGDVGDAVGTPRDRRREEQPGGDGPRLEAVGKRDRSIGRGSQASRKRPASAAAMALRTFFQGTEEVPRIRRLGAGLPLPFRGRTHEPWRTPKPRSCASRPPRAHLR